MKLVYENERGKVTMYGGGKKGINITRISGISLPENDVNTVRYPNIAGQTVTRSTPMERIITISADVQDESKKQILNAAKVFSCPGTIYITSFGKTKKIKARCMSFEPNKSKGKYIPFTVQFCADNPYFEDIYETKTQICSHKGMLSSPFVLGCKFSERMLRNNVVNHGDVAIEPVFEITSVEGAVCPQGIFIKNLTNGGIMRLMTNVAPGEIITVDVKNRKVTSSTRNNIISRLTQDTSLSRFSIDVGVSVVEIFANNAEGEISALCRHNNNYISAVV